MNTDKFMKLTREERRGVLLGLEVAIDTATEALAVPSMQGRDLFTQGAQTALRVFAGSLRGLLEMATELAKEDACDN